MAKNTIKIRKNDKRLQAFIKKITSTLMNGKRHVTPGFGTFSICTRKATADRPACKMAMFRTSIELRDYASGGPRPQVYTPHTDIVNIIIESMQSE